MREILGKRFLKHFCIINLLGKSNESIQPSCPKRTRPAGTHYCQVWQTDTDEICTLVSAKIHRHEIFYRTLLPVWDLENFRPMDFC